MKDFLLSVPVVFGVFFLIAGGLYVFLSKRAPRGKDHPEKFLPYSGGQDFPPTEGRLSYQAFFRIGLLFAVLHVAALTLSTLPLRGTLLPVGLAYLIGVTISAFVLAVFHQH
jgi:NADH:ubiquinone oxidoreductase subunit 3 (subunit A)